MIYPKNISQFNVFYIHFKNIIKVLCVLKENYHVLSEWALGSKKMLTTHWIVFTNTKSSSFSITYLSQQDSIKNYLKLKIMFKIYSASLETKSSGLKSL